MGLDKKIGFIGAGNMAGAIVRGLLAGSAATREQLFAADPDDARLSILRDELDIRTTGDNAEVAAWADVLVIAVKPQVIETVLASLAPCLTQSALVVSVAAGVTIHRIEAALPEGTRVIRTMPNTPALVRAGATAIARGTTATDADTDLAEQLFQNVGVTVHVPEKLLDAVTGLSGSGPAYVFLLIEALTEAGARVGLPTETALQLASQTVFGAAKLLIERGEAPARLREQVTSPGGTTVAGLKALVDGKFTETLIEAVEAATLRSQELGQGPGTSD